MAIFTMQTGADHSCVQATSGRRQHQFQNFSDAYRGRVAVSIPTSLGETAMSVWLECFFKIRVPAVMQ